MSKDKLEIDAITRKIIGSAYNVYNQLKFGYLESIYHNAMRIELAKHDLLVESEKPLNVFYDDKIVGSFYVDLLIEGIVIVELKSVQNIVTAHEVQLVNYLNGLKLNTGLLINFGPKTVDVKRKYRNPV